MKKLSLLLSLILALCALPALGEQAEGNLDLDGLTALVAQALPECAPEQRPVGSGTLFGAQVNLSGDGEPAMDLIYFLMDSTGGQYVRAYLVARSDAYRIDPGDAEAVNALMADWNGGQHVPIEYMDEGVLFVYMDNLVLNETGENQVGWFVRFVYDDIRAGLAELRTRAAAYLPDPDAVQTAVTAITREMVEATVDALRADREITGDIMAVTVDEDKGVVTLGGDSVAVDVSAPDRPDCWLIYRLLYGNTVCVDLWDQNGNYTVAGAAIEDALAAVDRWNEEGGGQRLWLEYGSDGTLYGEFGMVITGEATEDMALKFMAALAREACEALDYLDGKLLGRYAARQTFDDFTLPLPGDARLTVNGKDAADGVVFELDDGDGLNRVRCLWSDEVTDIADLDYHALIQLAFDDLGAGMKARGLAASDYSVQAPITDKVTLDGRDAGICYVLYVILSADDDGEYEMRQSVALSVSDGAFGTYRIIYDADFPNSYFTLMATLEGLRWNGAGEGR